MSKHAITYAAGAFFFAIAVSILVHFVGPEKSWINYASYIGFITFSAIGLKNYRDKINGGYITYGKSFGYLTLIALYFSIGVSLWTVLFYNVIAPEDLDIIKSYTAQQQLESFEKMGMSEEQMAKTLETAQKFTAFAFNPAFMAIMGLLGNMFFLSIINLITSAIMKKDPPVAGINTNTPPYTPAV
jgi:hypothetical protein